MWRNKVGLVTGALSGIGRSVALVWAREGAKAVVSDLDRERGEETVALLRAQGGGCMIVESDVGRPQDARAMVVDAVSHHGRLDMACNSAGIGGPSVPVTDNPLDGCSQVINVHLSGVFHCMQQQVAAMLKTGGGSIVNMASVLGAVGFATGSAYTAAKHGVIGLTLPAALGYSAYGIRINAVGPGFIHTPMISKLAQDVSVQPMLVAAHPIGRLGRPNEVADMAAWLRSDRSAFVAGGHYPADGGYLAR